MKKKTTKKSKTGSKMSNSATLREWMRAFDIVSEFLYLEDANGDVDYADLDKRTRELYENKTKRMLLFLRKRLHKGEGK